MKDSREVYSTVENGVKLYIALEITNEGARQSIYKIKASDISKADLDKLYGTWLKKGERFNFPKHDHLVWDLTLSSSIPEYSGINRPLVKEKLTKRAKETLQARYATLHSDILNTEIKKLKNNVFSLSKTSNKTEFDNYFKTAISIQKRIKEAKLKWERNPRNSNNWQQRLSPKDAYELNQSIQEVFERINNLRSEIESIHDKIYSKQRTVDDINSKIREVELQS